MFGLKWNENKRLQLVDVIKRRKRARAGVSCSYLLLSTKIGAKIYQTKQMRDATHRKQLYASEFGLAPLAGDCFSLECISIYESNVSYRMVYGYLTQNAVVPKYLSFDDEFDLKYQLRDIGIRTNDLCSKNVGYLGKRLVCIDFDSCSCQWIPKKKRNLIKD
jgi:hypothetical protein